LEPFAVDIPTTKRLLSKCRSRIYDAIGDGDLDAVKDGKKLLITLESIRRFQAKLPRATIKPPRVGRSHQRKHEQKKQRRA
jgi:hypothetical protein